MFHYSLETLLDRKDVVIISKYSHTVEYKLKTTLDSSGISKLQSEIKKTQTELKKLSEQNIISDSAMGTAQAQLSKFSKILNQSFNSKLGMLDLSRVNKLMNENALSIGKISTAFSMAGTKGEVAFNNVLGRIGNGHRCRKECLLKPTNYNAYSV